MKNYIPAIAAGIAMLLAVFIHNTGDISQNYLSAQLTQTQINEEVAFTYRVDNAEEQTITIPSQYDFPRPAEVKSVYSIYCCFNGLVRLLLDGVVVNEQQKTLHGCSRCSNDREDVDWQFPPGTVADRIEQENPISNGTATFIDILGQQIEDVSISDFAKDLGRIGSIVSTTGVSRVKVSSDNPEVMVWVGEEDDYNNQESMVLTDKLFACVDKDTNGQCDFLTLACSDGIDNDGDGKTDFPNDPGCDTPAENSELDDPLCSDGIDNDGDGKIDFPSDPGCESTSDGDETDPPPPPIERTVSFSKRLTPQIILQPPLAEREVLKINAPCSTCTVTTSPDHTQYIGGTPATASNFMITATVRDTSDNSVSYVIIGVGDFEEHDQIYTLDGKEYTKVQR